MRFINIILLTGILCTSTQVCNNFKIIIILNNNNLIQNKVTKQVPQIYFGI